MQQGGDIFTSLLPLIVLFAIFYFLIIRPQQKQQKEHKEMVGNLKKGDRIITNGGSIAEVVKKEDEFIKIKIGDNMIAKLSKEYVAQKLDEE